MSFCYTTKGRAVAHTCAAAPGKFIYQQGALGPNGRRTCAVCRKNLRGGPPRETMRKAEEFIMDGYRKSNKKTILLSVLIAVCCLTLIAGATLALFSGNAKYPISVNSGDIEIETAVTLNEAWRQGQNEDDRTVMDTKDVTDGSIQVVDEQGGSLGTVSIGDPAAGADADAVKEIGLQGIGRGVGARFTLSITNKSSVAMKYIAYINLGDSAFAQELTVEGADGAFAEKNGSSVVFTQTSEGEAGWAYASAAADPEQGSALGTVSFEISLPWDAATGGSAELTLVIEAVQSNAYTGNVSFGGTEYETLGDALTAAANSDETEATIYLGAGEQEIPADVSGLENKSVTVMGAGQNATTLTGTYTVPAGGSLTVENATVNGNIAANNGNVNLRNVTVNGAITSQSAAANTFTRALRTNAAQLAEVRLEGVTVNAESGDASATSAIYAKNAKLTLIDSSVNFTIGYEPAAADETAFCGVFVQDGTADIRNSDITVRSGSEKQINTRSRATGVYLNNTNTSLNGRDGTYEISNIENSTITVNSNFVYSGYPCFNDQALQLSTAEVRATDSTLNGGIGVGLFHDSKFTADGGAINALWYGISGNNMQGSAHIELTGGVSVKAEDVYNMKDNCAIYMPMQGTLKIDGATLEGYTGIQVRLGTIEIDNATVHAYGEKKIVTNDNQSTPEGSALLISSHAYNFTTHSDMSPAGYTDPMDGDNSLSVVIGESAVLESANWNPITYYDWAKVEQEVSIDSGAYEVYTVATNEAALRRLFANDGNISSYGKVLLNSDVTIQETSLTISEGATITLDLNGKTIKGTNAGSTIVNYGNLTVTGEGFAYSTDVAAQGRHAIENYGTLVIENGTFGSNGSRGNALRNLGSATVLGGNFTACDNYVNSGYAYAIANGSALYPEAVMTIEAANVYGEMNGAIASDGGVLTINGGKYVLGPESGQPSSRSCWNIAFTSGSGAIEINDGTFIRNVNYEQAFLRAYGENSRITVNGGTFEDLVRNYILIEEIGSVEINGGLFKDLPVYKGGVTEIGTAEELKAFASIVNSGMDFAGSTVILSSSIDISGGEWTPIAAGTRGGNTYTAESKTFSGTFDGNNNTIKGLTITQMPEGASADYAFGLFGVVDGGTIKNLNLPT